MIEDHSNSQSDSIETNQISRRSFAALATTVGMGSVAGCSGLFDSETGENTLDVAVPTSFQDLSGFTQGGPFDQLATYLNTDFFYRVDHNGEVQPGFVSDTTVEDDGQRWVLTIYDDIMFHPPYERELLAEDVVWNIEHVADPSSFTPRIEPWMDQAEWYDEDEKTVVIEFESPVYSWDAFMAGWHGFPVYCPDAIDDDMNMSAEPVATGPYVFEEWEGDSHLTFRSFDDYWRDDIPHIDEITFRPIPDGSTRVTELTEGDVDLLLDVPVDLVSVVEADNDSTVSTVSSFEITGLVINPTEETEENRGEDFPTTNREVREAISEAIDREEMVEIIYDGRATPTQNYFPEESPWHIDYNPHSMSADPDTAEALLNEAGFDEPEVTLVAPSDRPALQQIGELAAEDLRNAGFDVDHQEYEEATWSDEYLWAGRFDISVEDLPGAPAPYALRGFWDYQAENPGFFNYVYENAEEIYSRWDDALAEADFDTRQSILANVQEMMVDDPIRCVVCHPDDITAFATDVENYSTHPWQSNTDLHEAQLNF